MSSFSDKLQNIQQARKERDRLREAAYSAVIKGDPGQAEAKERLAKARADVQQAISSLYPAQGAGQGAQPGTVLNDMNDQIPFLLLPVRIETRFMTASTGGSELWVRVYPDDIAVFTHEQTLTDQEVQQGQAYWKAVYQARTGDPTQTETLQKGAWNSIATLSGANRSAWVVRQMQPTNWSSDLYGIHSPNELTFPVLTTKPSNWTQQPRTNVLPDQFVVLLYQGDTVVQQVMGNAIPDELFVGPDPMAPDSSFVTTGGKLVFGSSFDWMTDFSKAVANGMGFQIPLTGDQATQGFDKILVLGVLASADAASAATLLEELIDNHHYSTGGFALVPQGSPTSNDDQNASAYSSSDPQNLNSYAVETGAPLFTATTDCDGRNLAQALGIDIAPLQYVANADATDYLEAVAMNTALYPATLGYYLGTLLQPVLSTAAQQGLQNFFQSHVTGRGPLPAIRVGDQPYGVLLTSDFSTWSFPDNFLVTSPASKGIYKVAAHFQQLWSGLLGQLSYAGKPGSDPGSVLMNVLALQPCSVSFAQRVAFSTDYLINLDDFQYGGQYFQDIQQNFVSKALGMDFLSAMGSVPASIPQLLRLVYEPNTTTLDIQNLVGSSSQTYLDWLATVSSVQALEDQNLGTGITTPTALLYLELRRALLLSIHAACAAWFDRNGVNVDQTLQPLNFFNIRPAPDLTKWEVMKAKVGIGEPLNAKRNLAVADYLLTPGNTEPEAVMASAAQAAIQQLTGLPKERLERCFVEHLDTLTYRLDAWQTGLFRERLVAMRGRLDGIYLGAYGWVENVRPIPKTQLAASAIPSALYNSAGGPVYESSKDGGFVQAPSANHATAAAILRSGFLSYANNQTVNNVFGTSYFPANAGTAANAFGVNLSSARVRQGMLILEGIRNGQTLNALLGYQFERGLHDQALANPALDQLNADIYLIRAQFPIQQNAVQPQGTSNVQEYLPPNNTTDGLALALCATPFPYGVAGLTATAAEQAAIEAQVSGLLDTLDAVKDLMTSESVYQLVLGNFERSSAVINALQNMNQPPVLTMPQTPRSSQFSLTNRATIQFNNQDASPWTGVAATPRSLMEPGLNAWLGSILGDPASIECQVSQVGTGGVLSDAQVVSIADLELQAIDLVYICGQLLNTGAAQPGQENRTGVSELEARIAYYYRSKYNIADGQQLQIEFLQAGTGTSVSLGTLLPLLKALQAVITGSRYLHALDFCQPTANAPTDPTVANPRNLDPVDLTKRVTSLVSAYGTQIDALEAVPITATYPILGGTATLANLGQLFGKMQTGKLPLSTFTLTFSATQIEQLQEALSGASLFGLPNSFPILVTPATGAAQAILLDQAYNVWSAMQTADTHAQALVTTAAGQTIVTTQVGNLIEAGQAILQAGFNILPQFSYLNPTDVSQSAGDETQLLQYATGTLGMVFPADEWAQSAAQVRPKLSAWENVRMLYEVLQQETLSLQPIQVPYRADDSWIAVEFPQDDPTNSGQPFMVIGDTVSVVVHGADAFTAGVAQSGLMVDDWPEKIPVSTENTSIAFNYDQPNSFPPQALLLAVPPVIRGNWTWQDLVNIVNDTLLRAKLRAVDPALLDTLNTVECGVFTPAILSSFSQYDLDVAVDYRVNVPSLSETLQIKTAAEYITPVISNANS